MGLCFLIVVLPRESEVDGGGGFLVNDGLTERLLVSTPRPLPRLVGGHEGRAQVVRVQVVPLRLFVFQLAVADVRLPHWIGAPEAIGLGVWMEAVGFGQRSLLVGLGHPESVKRLRFGMVAGESWGIMMRCCSNIAGVFASVTAGSYKIELSGSV